MESVYHIVTIRVNETPWAHIWRLRSRYLGMGYDNQLPSASGATLANNGGLAHRLATRINLAHLDSRRRRTGAPMTP
jgi:hypothetical protein